MSKFSLNDMKSLRKKNMELWQELNSLRRAEKVLGQLPVGIQLGVNEMTTNIANQGRAMGTLCSNSSFCRAVMYCRKFAALAPVHSVPTLLPVSVITGKPHSFPKARGLRTT